MYICNEFTVSKDCSGKLPFIMKKEDNFFIKCFIDFFTFLFTFLFYCS